MIAKSLKCPDCGAEIQVKEDATKCFCTYCGTQIQFVDENTITHKYVDVAKIKEVESQERQNNKKNTVQRDNANDLGIMAVGTFYVAGLMMTVLISFNEDRNTINFNTLIKVMSLYNIICLFIIIIVLRIYEVKRLQNIEKAIHEDIELKNYRDALIKTASLSTNSIVMLQKDRQYWNDKRKQYKNLIHELQKES